MMVEFYIQINAPARFRLMFLGERVIIMKEAAFYPGEVFGEPNLATPGLLNL
jgi:hypothetical protein